MGRAKYYRVSTQQHLVKEVKLKYLHSWPQLQMEMGLHGLVLNGVQGTNFTVHRISFISRLITQRMQHCCCKAADDAAYSVVSSLPTTNPLHTYVAGNVKINNIFEW